MAVTRPCACDFFRLFKKKTEAKGATRATPEAQETPFDHPELTRRMAGALRWRPETRRWEPGLLRMKKNGRIPARAVANWQAPASARFPRQAAGDGPERWGFGGGRARRTPMMMVN